MTETLTFTPKNEVPERDIDTLPSTPEREASIRAVEGLAQRALHSAMRTAEQGGFTLSRETEAELRAVFTRDPSAPILPLSAHGLGCSNSTEGGTPHHAYLLPFYEPASE